MATGCLGNTSIFFKCTITRLFLMLHLLLLVWRVWETYSREYWYLSLAGPLVFMLIELAVVLYKRNGQEWRRFCPSFFFYLLSSIPSVWFIELNRLEAVRQDRANADNTTNTAELDFNGFKLSVTMTTSEWALAMEQTMMFLLIIGRWMLPKGDMSREQLSQLLLVYLGMAIDILELFEVFKETKVLNDKVFIYVVLSGFSWSLMQFTFLLTPPPKQKRPTRNQVVDIHVEVPEVDELRKDKFSFIYNEKFAIFVSLFMQDLPFLIIRLVSIFLYQVLSYANTFFTVKNGIMVILQCYRLVVLTCESLVDNDNDNQSRTSHGTINDT